MNINKYCLLSLASVFAMSSNTLAETQSHGQAVGASRMESVGAAQTITVGSKDGKEGTASWSTSTQTPQNARFITHMNVKVDNRKTALTVKQSKDGDTVTIQYQGPRGASGTRTVKGSQIVKDTFPKTPAIVNDARRLQALLSKYKRTPEKFTFTGPDGGTAAINWDCEIASLKAIVACGSFSSSACKEAVKEQFCQCVAHQPAPC
jgi:hypothetical protein